MPHTTIVELFNNELYRIPDYQRGYSWEKTQLEDFWQDLSYINLQFGENYYRHFFGTLTLDLISERALEYHEGVKHDTTWLCSLEGGNRKGYFIVDGQQRLTTVMILIGALTDWAENNNQQYIGNELLKGIREKFLFRERISDGSLHYLFGYEADDPSYDYWRQYIIGPKDVEDQTVVHTTYTRRLKDAYCYFNKKINNEWERKKESIEDSTFTSTYIMDIFQKVTNGLLINVDVLTQEFNVGIAFETMNNRGKKLSLLELLKNRLIYLATKLQRPDLRSQINNTWRTIYHNLGQDSSLEFDDDDFLKVHYIIYYGYSSDSDLYHKGLLNEKFNPSKLRANNNSTLATEITNYIRSIESGIKLWFEYHSCRPNPNRAHTERLKFWYQNIRYIGYGNFEPLLLSAMMRLHKDGNPFTENSTILLTNFIEAIERFRFIAFYIASSKSHIKRNDGYNLAREILSSEVNINQATQIVEGWTNSLGTYSSPVKERFKTMVSDLIQGGSGFYGWDGIRYFLYRYEMSLVGDASPLVHWESISNKTIEHVFPQTFNNVDYWRQMFGGYEKNAQIFLHALGNLALCSRNANTSYGNLPYIDRNNPNQSKYQKYADGTFSLREIATTYPDTWGPQQINRRTQTMMSFLIRTWNVDCLPSLDYNWDLYYRPLFGLTT